MLSVFILKFSKNGEKFQGKCFNHVDIVVDPVENAKNLTEANFEKIVGRSRERKEIQTDIIKFEHNHKKEKILFN